MVKRRDHFIPDTQHVAVCGRTGSGKTELLYAYVSGYDYVAVLDTKLEFTFGGYVLKDEIAVVDRLDRLDEYEEPKIIYRPRLTEMKMEYYDQFYWWCYYRENTVCVTDEVMSVAPNPSVIPEGLKAVMTRGRSKHVPHWGATQRPSGIPQLILSEASHFFVYDLNLPQDRKKLMEITGAPQLWERPNSGKSGKYNFWYYNVAEDEAIKARLILAK
ncbi:hypothetical protein PMI08_03160 [Brevibacillus sp. CF112]|uniref:hypothetical protein n=1 Tax=Brevibacillus sp. CF112 TaxID=1144311 RepID=UPI0002718818|nr:hypothetical protein [Brevibacillus sp. CF112]EJL42509.1 hypothetical protein PMI08_03160 [Brevibacillus sp. CF112]